MKKGFTLIELLVVIAIIGVMMAAVIVSINPTKRLQDARDSNRKQAVASTASAAEACITKNLGVNTTCSTMGATGTPGTLVGDGYLKLDPITALCTGAGNGLAALGTDGVTVTCSLENGGTGCTKWVYSSANGKAACVP